MTAMTLDAHDRLLAGLVGDTPTTDLPSHLAVHGQLGLPEREDPRWRSATWRAVSESGLRGRGGAAFPSGAKWDGVRHSGRRPLLVVNAMEGEPASAKDRVLLTHSPHLLLDGAEVVATVLGATQVVVCVANDNGPAAATVEAAIAERAHAGRRRIQITVARPPGRYVTGEESALGLLAERAARATRLPDGQVRPAAGRAPTGGGAQR